MARNFGGTSSDYLSHGASVVGSGRAMTISAWTKGSDFSGYPVAAGILDNADAAARAIILIDPSGAAFWQYKNGGSEGNAISSNTTTTGAWAHVVGCEESSSSRFAVLNGDWANRGTNGTSVSAFTQDRTRIGSALGILAFPGDIAEVGIWDVALTQGEIEALSKGFSPLLIRPGSLVAYWPIIGRASPEIDPVGGYAMTVNGTASASAHPRVIYPRRRVAQKFTTAGGGGGPVVPVFVHHRKMQGAA